MKGIPQRSPYSELSCTVWMCWKWTLGTRDRPSPVSDSSLFMSSVLPPSPFLGQDCDLEKEEELASQEWKCNLEDSRGLYCCLSPENRVWLSLPLPFSFRCIWELNHASLDLPPHSLFLSLLPCSFCRPPLPGWPRKGFFYIPFLPPNSHLDLHLPDLLFFLKTQIKMILEFSSASVFRLFY